MKKSILTYLKSIGYVLIIQAIALGTAALTLNSKPDSQMALLTLFGIIILFFVPLYFILKRSAEKPLLYLIVTAASNIIISDAVLLLVEKLYKEPDFGAFHFAVLECFVGIYFAVIALIDIAAMICKKFHRTNIKKTTAFPET